MKCLCDHFLFERTLASYYLAKHIICIEYRTEITFPTKVIGVGSYMYKSPTESKKALGSKIGGILCLVC